MSSVPGNDGNTVEEETERFPILRQCYDNKTQVLITCRGTCRGGKMKLRGRVQSFAKDGSVVLENLREWIEKEVSGEVSRQEYNSKEYKTMRFVKGNTIDSVISTDPDSGQEAYFIAMQKIESKESTSK